MRTMSGGPCLHYDCTNRNSFGYCKTTACINEHYQREQWGLPSTTNKSESMVIKPQTNGDRIRQMSDEELANFIGFVAQDAFCYGRGMRDKMLIYPQFGEYEATINWLKEEVADD